MGALLAGGRNPLNVYPTVYVALIGAAALPATSRAPLQVAVKLPTPLEVPPVTCRLAAVATPESVSVVLQIGVGTLWRPCTAPLVTPARVTAGGVLSIITTTTLLAALVLPAASLTV